MQINNNTNFDLNNRFIIKNYDLKDPVSNFLNGLSGEWGSPMWAFFVNRGQAITSFGIQNKDQGIMKFVTAEKAYFQTNYLGFRTFLRLKYYNNKNNLVSSHNYQPFFQDDNIDNSFSTSTGTASTLRKDEMAAINGANRIEEDVDAPQTYTSEPTREGLERNMYLGSNEMEIEEINLKLGLKTNILYFTSPSQDFPTFVRQINFTNINSDLNMEVDSIDGMMKVIPRGLNNFMLDSMGRTMEAWMNVYNLKNNGDSSDLTSPFFHISQDPGDNPQVIIIKDGYYAISFLDSNTISNDPLPYIVDPSILFGSDTTYSFPKKFFYSKKSINDFRKLNQGTTSRTPCAFSMSSFKLSPKETKSLTTYYGYAEDLATFNEKYSKILKERGYVSNKRFEANNLADSINNLVSTKTSNDLFNAYVRQNFFDNILRGGLPISFSSPLTELNGKELSDFSKKYNSNILKRIYYEDSTTISNVAPIGMNPGESKIFHIFSRIHGDIERDYNFFQVDMTYFSQGPGNFRDVCQNRRWDTYFYPSLYDFNLKMFLSFIQSDGFNPLTVASPLFKLPSNSIESVINKLKLENYNETNPNSVVQKDKLKKILEKTFRPGQLFLNFKQNGLKFELSNEEILTIILNESKQDFAGQFSQNGYWTDHWTYIYDLLENFLYIFPEKEEEVLTGNESVSFFLSPALVKSREERYLPVVNSNGKNSIRVYQPIYTFSDSSQSILRRKQSLEAIYSDPSLIADNSGVGGFWQRSEDFSVMRVTPLAKFLMLSTLKFSSLDPLGMGVEMEGGKPGWNDAMNGLPGLLGSSMPETYETLRILRYIEKFLSKNSKINNISVPIEFHEFFTDLLKVLVKYPSDNTFNTKISSQNNLYKYWDESTSLREVYYNKVVSTFNGDKKEIDRESLLKFLDLSIKKINHGINFALITTNSLISPTYFYYDSTNITIEARDNKSPLVTPLEFTLNTLPLFLEGPTRHLKVLNSIEERRKIYKSVISSTLYDKSLKMFTLSESLQNMAQEIGRMKAFAPGWLENQSVWLHMSYKFYLELLRGELYEEFFTEISKGLVPFMNYLRYGRSPLEAASFIVSSAFPDKNLHGKSFLARLSGSTAEFLSIWILMMAGPNPFIIDPATEHQPGSPNSGLKLYLKPTLPGYFFTKDENLVSFLFLGKIKVTYYNPLRLNTWEVSPKSGEAIYLNGDKVSSEASSLFNEKVAQACRNGEIKEINVYF